MPALIGFIFILVVILALIEEAIRRVSVFIHSFPKSAFEQIGYILIGALCIYIFIIVKRYVREMEKIARSDSNKYYQDMINKIEQIERIDR